MRESLRVAGVENCQAFSVADDDTGRSGRVCQYVLATNEALDDYLDNAASNTESDIASRFGHKVEVRSRVLREDLTHDVPLGDTANCLNCGTHLRGQYCGHCGQRARSRLISLWELITDAFGDLFEIDSRLWQTVVPLLLRPGRLTRDYLQGRRARYMPPFRMYLVTSVIFFMVAFFDPSEELSLFLEPATQTTAPSEEQAAEPVADGVVEDTQSGFVITMDTADGEHEHDCDDIEVDELDEMPAFLARRLSVERLTQVCKQVAADKGKNLTAKVIDNTPAALVVLLPLMALVLKALYPLSRRFYVEHLLFFVHFHAFVFLLLTLQILFARLATMLGISALGQLTIVAMSLYIPAYVFVAMRKVYGQGRIVTFLKYIILVFAYIIGFTVIIATTFAIAAFSI